MIDNDEAEKIRKELKIQMKSLKWKFYSIYFLRKIMYVII